MELWAEAQPPNQAGAAGDPRQVQPTEGHRFEHTLYGIEDPEGSAAEPERERNLEHRPIWSALPHLATWRQPIRHDRSAYERRPIVHGFETEERADARVHIIPARYQRGDGVRTNAISPRPKRRGPLSERLLHDLGQRPDLGQLQPGRQVVRHGVACDERFAKRGRVPRMQVRADLRTALVPDLAHDGSSARIDGHLVAREVGGAHAPAIEKARLALQLPDVLDRHAGAAAAPVVLFGVERHDERNSAHG